MHEESSPKFACVPCRSDWHWLADWRNKSAGRLLCGLEQARVQPTQLDFCAGLDRSLCDDRYSWRRTWLQENNSLALQLWLAQMLLNFSCRRYSSGCTKWTGLTIILMLLATIVGFIAVQIRENRPVPGLFVPYAAWVAFARP
jgi:hypothetical protein